MIALIDANDPRLAAAPGEPYVLAAIQGLAKTAGPGLRFLPPLTITQEEMDKGLAIMRETLR